MRVALGLPSAMFNRTPQCRGLGIMPRGAYIFAGNVVLMDIRQSGAVALRLVNKLFPTVNLHLKAFTSP